MHCPVFASQWPAHLHRGASAGAAGAVWCVRLEVAVDLVVPSFRARYQSTT